MIADLRIIKTARGIALAVDHLRGLLEAKECGIFLLHQGNIYKYH